jgi:hypothetical protein
MALLTLVQQQANKFISENWANTVKVVGGVTQFEQLQIEVEDQDLKKLLGPALLYDIQQNPTDPKYINLLDGLAFQDCNDNTVEFKGIRYQLSFMNYGEYVPISGHADTFTGMVRQNRTETTPLSEGAIKREQSRAREIALTDFEVMKTYLNDNTDTYPLWNCTNKKKLYTPKLFTVRKTFK